MHPSSVLIIPQAAAKSSQSDAKRHWLPRPILTLIPQEHHNAGDAHAGLSVSSPLLPLINKYGTDGSIFGTNFLVPLILNTYSL